MSLSTMYKGIPFSPIATLLGTIGPSDTIIRVSNIGVFPPPPNYASIGTSEDAETIEYSAVTSDSLSGCIRGIEGIARTWNSGEVISRNFTNADYGKLIENIREIDESNTATQAALDGKAPMDSPALTGIPTAPTAPVLTNNTQIATTEFVKSQGYITNAPVVSVAGRTGAVVLNSADVNLGNVDNTSDANKPVSSATKAALDGKAPTNHASAGDEYGPATNTMKGHVALSNGTSTTADIRAVAYQYLASPTSVDLNNYRLHGEWTLNDVTEALNFPLGPWTGTNYPSFLKVIRLTSDTNVLQILWRRATNEIWIRYGLTATSWGQWVAIQASVASYVNITSDRTLISTDMGKTLDVNSTATRTIIIPNDDTENFPAGTRVEILRANTGAVNITPASGVTLQSLGGLRSISGQYGAVSLQKRSSNTWRLTGDLA